MKQRICAVGSCQSTMVAQYLRANPTFMDEFDIWAPAKQVYQMTDDDIAGFHAALSDVDILLAQPVSDDYRSPAQVSQPAGALSSKNLISRIKPTGRAIMFPVMFFGFYHPSYFRPAFRKPSDNHDLNLLQLYARDAADRPLNDSAIDRIIEEYLSIVGDERLYPESALLHRGEKALAELREREAAMMRNDYARPATVIPLSDFIAATYLDTHLFSTVNHPRHQMYEHLVEHVCDAIKVPYAPHQPDRHPHESDVGVVYRALSSVVAFDVSGITPLLSDAAGSAQVAMKYIAAYEADRGASVPLALRYADRVAIPAA